MGVQDAAKTGKPLDAIKLHSCQCPPCFTEYMNKDGSIDCKPKCDLDTCDERSGICQGGFSGAGGALLSSFDPYCGFPGLLYILPDILLDKEVT